MLSEEGQERMAKAATKKAEYIEKVERMTRHENDQDRPNAERRGEGEQPEEPGQGSGEHEEANAGAQDHESLPQAEEGDGPEDELEEPNAKRRRMQEQINAVREAVGRSGRVMKVIYGCDAYSPPQVIRCSGQRGLIAGHFNEDGTECDLEQPRVRAKVMRKIKQENRASLSEARCARRPQLRGF